MAGRRTRQRISGVPVQGAGSGRRRGRTAAKAIACFAVLAVLVVPALYVNMVIGYLPALFFVLLVALSFLYVRICARGLVFDELAEADSCERGSSVKVLLRLRNALWLYIPRVDAAFTITDLFGNDSAVETASISIGPHCIRDFDFDLGFDHLGEFGIGLRELTVHDPLSLFTVSVPTSHEHSILVTPRLRRVRSLPLSDVSVQEVSDALHVSDASGTDYCGVREYVPGDPMKTIHWKLSARIDGYFTKVFEEHSDPGIDIFVNLFAPEGLSDEELMDVYDAAVEAALTLESYARCRGLNARLVFLNRYGEAEQLVFGPSSDFRTLMQRLPRISAHDPSAFNDLLVRQATSIHAADNIAVCSALLDPGLVETLVRVKGTQRSVSLFALLPDGLDAEQRREATAPLRVLDNAGIPAYALDNATDVIA